MTGDNRVLAMLGRRLRLGVIGGGGEALIGPVHRAASRLDDLIEVSAGVLSSDAERSKAEAARLGIPRGYGDAAEMIAAEAARDDGIDAVAIMTPNDSHYPLAMVALEAGLDVVCDKPLTNDLEEARALAAKVRDTGRVFCLTHNYSGYPMVRQARAMVEAGELGRVHLVHVTYAQGTLGSRVEDGDIPARLRWRLDPGRGGRSHVMGDIGTHAHQLATYITQRPVTRVMADLGAVVAGREAHDTGSLLLELEAGAKGVMWVTKAATGAENALSIEVYGDEGGLFWQQAELDRLRFMRQGRPAELLSRGLPTLHPLARHATRLPPGHPEGFIEGFANLYADFALTVAARRAGQAPDPLASTFPTAEDGVAGVELIEAALASSSLGCWQRCG